MAQPANYQLCIICKSTPSICKCGKTTQGEMAKQRRSLDKRRQVSLLNFGVKRGVAPSAVNVDLIVLRPSTQLVSKLTGAERFEQLIEKVIDEKVNKKGVGRPIKLRKFIGVNTHLQRCDVELGSSLVAGRDYEKDPRK